MKRTPTILYPQPQMKLTTKSANSKPATRRSKGSKRDRENDDSQDDPSSAATKKLAFQPKGSIQAVFLGETPIQPHLYQEWFSAGYFNFSFLPWDVIQNNILIYLNYTDTIALARTTRQWYRRIANVACSKFEIFLRSEFEKDFAEREERLNSKYPEGAKSDLATSLRDRLAADVGGAFQHLTPLAISYFSDIGKVIYNKRCRVQTRLTAKSKKWDRCQILKDFEVMLRRIEAHGNIDSYKIHTLLNNQRLDELFKIEADRVQRNCRLFWNMLTDEGCKSKFELWIMADSCQIRIKPNFYRRKWETVGGKLVEKPDPLNTLYKTLRYKDEADLRALDINELIPLLVDAGLADRSWGLVARQSRLSGKVD
jgi:hypothetical protein